MNQQQSITLTNTAVAHFQKMLQSQKKALGIRFGVKNAGCSGMAYVIEFALEIKNDDQKFETAGVQVIVDQKSLSFLKGTEIDCVQQGLNAYLKFNNPNIKGECGCGESFTADEQI